MAQRTTHNYALQPSLPGVIFILTILGACGGVPQQPHRPAALPTSPWGNGYSFSWSPPPGSKEARPLTIAVVNADFNVKDCNPSVLYYRQVVKGFAHSLAVDLDRALVAKGIRVTGPFDAFNDLTYAEKQAADFALTPAVCVKNMNVGYGPMRSVGYDNVTDYVVKPFMLDMEIEILFVLKEPSTEEKLWVKKIGLDPAREWGDEAYQAVPRMKPITVSGGLFSPDHQEQVPDGYDSGALLYDGKQDAIATMFRKLYPTIMAKAWTYLDVDEMLHMKPTVEEIRKKSTVIQR